MFGVYEGNSYDDIIDLPHHVSSRHPRMPVVSRAAQFAPFAALTGYDAVIRETGRLTREKVTLDEDERLRLGAQLTRLKECAGAGEISVTYFVPDGKKSGGEYVTVSGEVKRVDGTRQMLIMADGRQIAFDDILYMDGAVFGGFDGAD